MADKKQETARVETEETTTTELATQSKGGIVGFAFDPVELSGGKSVWSLGATLKTAHPNGNMALEGDVKPFTLGLSKRIYEEGEDPRTEYVQLPETVEFIPAAAFKNRTMFVEGDAEPACKSQDGLTAVNGTLCATCPNAKFGKKADGKGWVKPACSESINLLGKIKTEAGYEPVIISNSGSNFKPASAMLQELRNNVTKAMSEVVYTIGYEKHKSDTFKWSSLTYKLLRKSTPEEIKAGIEQAAEYAEVALSQAKAANASEDAAYEEDELPFN